MLAIDHNVNAPTGPPMRFSNYEGAPLISAAEVVEREEALPGVPGCYLICGSPRAVKALGVVDRSTVVRLQGQRLLYVGSAGRSLRIRVREHLAGPPLTTLRTTLVCLLHTQLELAIHPRPRTPFIALAPEHARILNEWVAAHLSVAVFPCSNPLGLESALLNLVPGLANIHGCKDRRSAQRLLQLRREVMRREGVTPRGAPIPRRRAKQIPGGVPSN